MVNGVVVNGQKFEVDCIVFVMGFEVGMLYICCVGCDVQGCDGLFFFEKWFEGFCILYGFIFYGFFNFFFISVVQGGFIMNFFYYMDEVVCYVGYILGCCFEEGFDIIELSCVVEDVWVEEIIKFFCFNEEFFDVCIFGYYNNEGKFNFVSCQNLVYGKGLILFFWKMVEWW